MLNGRYGVAERKLGGKSPLLIGYVSILSSVFVLLSLSVIADPSTRVLGWLLLLVSTSLWVRSARTGVVVTDRGLVVRKTVRTTLLPYERIRAVGTRHVWMGLYEHLEIKLIGDKLVAVDEIGQVVRRRQEPGPLDRLIADLNEVLDSRSPEGH